MAKELEQQRGKNQALDDALSMECHGLVSLGNVEERMPLTGGAMSYRQLCLLVLISNRLKEVTERLMEVEKLLKERGQ